MLDSVLDATRYDTATCHDVCAADSVCVYHPDRGELDIFAVNKSAEPMDFRVAPACFGELEPFEQIEPACDDLYARNSAQHPDVISPVSTHRIRIADHEIRCELAAYSWNDIRIKERQVSL